jgi:hypothetical protein
VWSDNWFKSCDSLKTENISAELEINVDVKYVGHGRIKGRVGTVWGKWERGKDFGKWVTCGKY